MAIEPLSDELIEAGAAMLRELDTIGLEPQGALWLHFHALNDWRFTVISDLVDMAGRRKVYGLIEKALAATGSSPDLTIFDIHLASSAEVMPRVLGGAIHIKAGTAHVQDCSIDGAKVDAVIYRLLPARPESERRRAIKRFDQKAKELISA